MTDKKKPAENFVYVNKKKDEKQEGEAGPYVVVLLFEDGRYESTDEPEHEYNSDAFARACSLNREIGYSEFWSKAFATRVRAEKRSRQREEEQKRREEQRLVEEAERKRKREEEIAAGSPGMRSPEKVVQDAAYEEVASVNGNTYPNSIQFVVRHKATNTLWACLYGVRDDDSDYGCETS